MKSLCLVVLGCILVSCNFVYCEPPRNSGGGWNQQQQQQQQGQSGGWANNQQSSGSYSGTSGGYNNVGYSTSGQQGSGNGGWQQQQQQQPQQQDGRNGGGWNQQNQQQSGGNNGWMQQNQQQQADGNNGWMQQQQQQNQNQEQGNNGWSGSQLNFEVDTANLKNFSPGKIFKAIIGIPRKIITFLRESGLFILFIPLLIILPLLLLAFNFGKLIGGLGWGWGKRSMSTVESGILGYLKSPAWQKVAETVMDEHVFERIMKSLEEFNKKDW